MAGHSHWAGIKHKKGRADKEIKNFLKLSREITVAAKLGDKDPLMNQDIALLFKQQDLQTCQKIILRERLINRNH